MKIAVCVEAIPSAAAWGATRLALSIPHAHVCWVHAGAYPFDAKVPAGVSSVATIVEPTLAHAHGRSVAMVLAKALQRWHCDAAFCGVLSNEAGTGFLGAALAVMWSVPFVAQAHAVKVHDTQFHVSVHGAAQIATVAVTWPCVLTCVPAAEGPLEQNHHAPAQTLTLQDLGIAKESLGKPLDVRRDPRTFPRTKTVNGAQALRRALRRDA